MSYSSDFLAQGFMGNLTTLHDLQFRCRMTNEQAADMCGVSPETYRRWLKDRRPSVAAVKLLAILAGYVPWYGWEEWEVHNGYLFPPGFVKNGMTAGDLHSMVFLRQLVSEQRRKIASLENTLYEIQRERPGAPVLSLVSK
jgi:transcriptional regulator with XRE-family HTH domain